MASKPEDMQEHCDVCGDELEIGQIGKCDSCRTDGGCVTWANYYLCPCGAEWIDQWTAACNDRCPACHKEIEPYISDDGSVSDDEIENAYRDARARMGLFQCTDCSAIKDRSFAAEQKGA